MVYPYGRIKIHFKYDRNTLLAANSKMAIFYRHSLGKHEKKKNKNSNNKKKKLDHREPLENGSRKNALSFPRNTDGFVQIVSINLVECRNYVKLYYNILRILVLNTRLF